MSEDDLLSAVAAENMNTDGIVSVQTVQESTEEHEGVVLQAPMEAETSQVCCLYPRNRNKLTFFVSLSEQPLSALIQKEKRKTKHERVTIRWLFQFGSF